MRTVSMRGKPVDFARFMNENADQIALGNAMMNARGDQLDAKGHIVRTREEIAQTYHTAHSKSVRQVAVSHLESEVFKSPADAVKEVEEAFKRNEKAKTEAAEAKFAPKTEAAPAKTDKVETKRKITDSEE